MGELLTAILDSKAFFVYGPLGVFCAILTIALWYLWRQHEKLHEEYLKKVLELKDEYIDLTKNVEETLDTLIRLLSNKK